MDDMEQNYGTARSQQNEGSESRNRVGSGEQRVQLKIPGSEQRKVNILDAILVKEKLFASAFKNIQDWYSKIEDEAADEEGKQLFSVGLGEDLEGRRFRTTSEEDMVIGRTYQKAIKEWVEVEGDEEGFKRFKTENKTDIFGCKHLKITEIIYMRSDREKSIYNSSFIEDKNISVMQEMSEKELKRRKNRRELLTKPWSSYIKQRSEAVQENGPKVKRLPVINVMPEGTELVPKKWIHKEFPKVLEKRTTARSSTSEEGSSIPKYNRHMRYDKFSGGVLDVFKAENTRKNNKWFKNKQSKGTTSKHREYGSLRNKATSLSKGINTQSIRVASKNLKSLKEVDITFHNMLKVMKFFNIPFTSKRTKRNVCPPSLSETVPLEQKHMYEGDKLKGGNGRHRGKKSKPRSLEFEENVRELLYGVSSRRSEAEKLLKDEKMITSLMESPGWIWLAKKMEEMSRTKNVPPYETRLKEAECWFQRENSEAFWQKFLCHKNEQVQ